MRKLAVKPKRWQLQEAKAKFSRVVDEMLDHGPQIITRHGKDVAAVISIEDLPKVFAPAGRPQKPQPGMLETLLKCPKGSDLKIERDKNDNILDLPRIFE